MKNLIGVIFILLIMMVWLFPCIISFYTWDFWYTFLYFVWWMPAIFLTTLLAVVWDETKRF